MSPCIGPKFNTHTSKDHENSNRFRWAIDYTTIDLVAGINFELHSCLTFHPFGGIRFADIDQNLGLEELILTSQGFNGPR